MNFKCAHCEEKDGIAIFTIDRPQVLNALDAVCQEELLTFAEYFDQADHLYLAILTGAGKQAFVSGADINMLESAQGLYSLGNKLRKALWVLEHSAKPVLCAVNGVAFGGGFEIALACDIRIVSDNASFALPETGLGILPGAGGTQRLTHITGAGIAKDMILAGRRLNAQEAVQYGLAIRAVPQDALMEETLKLAKRILSKGPAALRISKQLINASTHMDLDTGITMESLGLAVLLEGPEKQEGVRAFLEKRPPRFL